MQVRPGRSDLGPGSFAPDDRVLIAADEVYGRRPAAGQFPGTRAVSARGSRALSPQGPRAVRSRGSRAVSFREHGPGPHHVSPLLMLASGQSLLVQVGGAMHLFGVDRTCPPASATPSQVRPLRRGECVLRLRPLGRVTRPAWHYSGQDGVSGRAGADNSSLASPV